MTVLASTTVALPVRPTQRVDEWFETYLGRLARANGVQRPWRQDLERIRFSCRPPLVPVIDGVPAYGGKRLPKWAAQGRGAQIRYCPACLIASRYIRARWRLPSFEICTLHNLRLKPGLVEPAISAAYNGPGKWQIDQILPDEIWSGATCPLSCESDFARAIWGQFEQAVEEGKVENVDQVLGWAILAERLLDSLVTSVRGPDYPSRDVQRSTHRAAWLRQHGLSISASYDGVLGFLLGLKLNAHLRSAASCLRMIIREEERQESLLSYFPLQKLHDRLLAATPETQVPAASGALARELHPAGYVSLEKAEALIGCRPGLLNFWVREGFFRSVVIRKPGKKRYVFICRAEVEDCRRWFSMSLSCNDVQSYLQIDRRGYWALLDSQLLRPISLGDWSWHRRQDISTLLCRLDEVSKPLADSAVNLQPFMGEWMHRRGRARTTLIQVIQEILRGELPLYRKLSETGLRAYFVDTATPERLRWLSSVHQMQTAREARHIDQLSLLEPADV